MLARVMPSWVAAMERSRRVMAVSTARAPLTPWRDHLLDARFPHRDQGELGGDEQAVEHDQGRDAQKAQQVPEPGLVCLSNVHDGSVSSTPSSLPC